MAERVVKVRLTAQISEYATAMEEAANKTRAVGSESERLAKKKEDFQQLGAGMVVVGGAMTALSLAVLKTGIEYNTLQQTSRAALTTLLGGAVEANAQMDKLDEFARTSPFSKAVFIQAQQQMLGFGVAAKDVLPALDSIQNAVAAMGGGNEQISALAEIMARIKSEGRLSGDALQRMGYYGIDAATIIGSQMGKTAVQIRDMASKPGGIPVDQIWNPLVEGLQEKFGGAADNVKQTFAGAMDRVQAAWRDLSAELASPLVDPSGGGALVDLLNWAADMMRAFQQLPEPIRLTGGAMFALTGFITLASGAALLATPRLIAMKVAFMALSTTMRGVAIAGGIAVLALAAVAAVIGAVSAAQARAQQLADDYAGALRQGADAATKFVAEQLAMKDSFLWMDRGSAVENAKKLGISLDEVTKAVTGSAAEYEAFKDRVMEAYDAAGKTLDAGYAMEQLQNKVTDLRGAQDLATQQALDTEEANSSLAGSYDEAADATADLEQQTKLAEDALKGMQTALDEVAGSAMSMADSQDAALSAVNKLVDAAEQEGASLYGANEASIKFRDAIRDVETAHRDSAEAILNNGGTLADATAEWEKGRQKVIDMRVAKGEDIATATAWADQNLGSASQVTTALDGVYRAWLNLPENRETKYKVEAAEASAKLADLKARLDAIPNNKYTRVTLEAFRVGNFDVAPNAAGGLYAGGVKKFAGGGLEPGIYPYRPGGIHKFAEEYAEGYVSMDPRRRTQSEGVWNAIGQHMGFGQAGSSSQPQQLSLDGLSISGTLDLGNGLTGFIKGIVTEHDEAQSRKIRRGVGR